MHRYWTAISVFLAAFFAVVVTLGFQAELNHARVHIAAAFFLVVAILFSHSLVVFFLIGSGRAIREAIHEKPWSKPYLSKINVFRLKSFPWALGSMVSGILAAWSGAGAHTMVWSTQTHRVVALVCLGTNLFGFVVEWAQLRANSRMIAELQAKLDAEEPSSEGAEETVGQEA
ncbi:MAG: hypothetical protein K8T20_11385 [Planctomycetes bacterium]|nr:hypothetical protein [Planctomycetota bacterium]